MPSLHTASEPIGLAPPASPAAGPVGLRAIDARQLQVAAANAAALMRALSNPERLMLLCALAEGESCVFDLAQATGIQQPTLSQQLAVLRAQGLVATRREGKFIHYRLASAPAIEVLAVLHRLFCIPPELESPSS